jgi:hypothetical protein
MDFEHSSNSQPLVSALICAFNAERFIEETLMSVWHQTYVQLEILILDNASHDNTYNMLLGLSAKSPYPMHIFRSEVNLGVPAGLNFLLDNARGVYASILDHDDFWHEDKTQCQVEFLEKHPDFPGCGGQTYVWWEATGRVSLWKVREYDNLTFHSSLMFRNRREWRYNPSLYYRADSHFTQDVLCGQERQLYNFQRPLLVWRMRSDRNNLSRRWNSIKTLWLYWRQTREHMETLKGLVVKLLPESVFDFLLQMRHSISDCQTGDAALEGFPPPVGPPGLHSNG